MEFTLCMCVCTGITNTAARVVIGLLAILPWVNTIIVHNMSLILMGVALIGNQFCLNFYAMCVSAGLFGVGLGKVLFLSKACLQSEIVSTSIAIMFYVFLQLDSSH